MSKVKPDYYPTENQNLLDFARYKVDDQIILVGGPIPMDETVILDPNAIISSDSQVASLEKQKGELTDLKLEELQQKALEYGEENFVEELKIQDRSRIIKKMEEVLTERIKERKYEVLYNYYQSRHDDLPHRPLSEFIDRILSNYDYNAEDNLIPKGLEPALVVGNAKRMIDSRLREEVPPIPYLHQYIFSDCQVRSLKLDNKDFGIAIYGDDHHVSGVLTVSSIQRRRPTVYVFDSTGDLHQNQNLADGTCGIIAEKIARKPSEGGIVVSLNPLGFKFQGGYSDRCGFWSSCFIAEASRYKSIEDFTIKVNYEGKDIILPTKEFLMDVVVSVLQSIDRESITTKDYIPKDKLHSYIKLPGCDYYIKKNSPAINGENKDVDLEELREFIKKFNELDQRRVQQVGELSERVRQFQKSERRVSQKHASQKYNASQRKQSQRGQKSSLVKAFAECTFAENGRSPKTVPDTSSPEKKICSGKN